MDIQRKCFEESNNINPDWSFKFDEELKQYVATDFEMTNQVDEFNEHWDTFRAGWQAAKAQAVPEGFVLVPEDTINAIYTTCDMALDSEAVYRSALIEVRDAISKFSEMIEAQEQSHV